MPSTRKPAAQKKATKPRKPAAKRKSTSSGALVDVARKIGTTLGEVAVRTGIVKPGSSEPAGE